MAAVELELKFPLFHFFNGFKPLFGKGEGEIF
jgi:hypothetical protein